MNLYLHKFYRIVFGVSLMGLVAIVLDFGFTQTDSFQQFLDVFYFFVLGVAVLSIISRYIQRPQLFLKKVFVFDLVYSAFLLWIFYLYIFVGSPFETDLLLENPMWLRVAVLLIFVRESSELKIDLKRTVFNPAQLFILSFIAIIFIGSFLLKLPNATYSGITYIDALFTSTSAVCVTGLVVVDTGSHFTLLGQIILMILIQVGGLGILTFTSFFSYFFKGGTSYESQLALSEMTSAKKLAEVFMTLKRIILITFSLEIFAGVLIFSSLNSIDFATQSEQIFFSMFHSVSAFCNAGFSTLSNSLYDTSFRYNYYLQLVIIFTFVLGGLGFPIIVNVLKYFKYKVIRLFSNKKSKYLPWVLSINSRIALITTFALSLFTFAIFYILEYNNTLAEHNGIGKLITALFGATTPRTAGFNTIDTASLTFPVIMLIIFMMWIGASSQSTGGGIKTNTFAIAILNILSLAKGKTRIEVFGREIAFVSVRRAFAIITLSLFIIGFAIMLLYVFEPQMNILDIAFECFSAYSTVGLSLGITSDLSAASKFVLIVVMFVGRISILSLLFAVFKKARSSNYRYPTEEIVIN